MTMPQRPVCEVLRHIQAVLFALFIMCYKILRGCRTKQLVRSLLFVKKITARPRKSLAVGVRLMYDQTH